MKNILHSVLIFAAFLLVATGGSLPRQIILLSALPSATITAMFVSKLRSPSLPTLTKAIS